MNARQLGQLLLRSNASSLPLYLAPSFLSPISKNSFTHLSYIDFSRAIVYQNAIGRSGDIRPTSSATATKNTLDEDEQAQPETQFSHRSSRRLPDKRIEQQKSMLARLQQSQSTSGLGSQKPSGETKDMYASILDNTIRSSVATNKSQGPEPMTAQETSADIVTAAYQKSLRYLGRPQDKSYIADKMIWPFFSTPPTTQDEFLDQSIHEEPTRAQATIKSRPSVGRTVEVLPNRGMDLGRAIRTLEITCAVNNIRQDSIRQKFHERPGMKRKRLKRERWRRRFGEGFRAIVGKVKTMRRKGW
ncbi:MAG: hypothetical protein LQ351_003833 [Letrouitia transgressa]|nr:MAG: hypothetical protein LQ351_003833 [Letrouitia transgressa]